MAPLTSLRNLALVAHVDHGKTTLVDAMLRATHVFGSHEALVDRVMDSNDQERERGITILAKAASVQWGDTRINLVDTPGHADFGGEVERALALVDGVLLLVDAAEGPLPQTRYVLSKALAAGLPAVVVLNKVDRQDARADEVLDEIYQLFLDLDADDEHIEFPVISAVAREGRAIAGVGMPSEDADLTPLFEAIIETLPAPGGDPEAPLQAIVTNLDASEYLGRLAVGRVIEGTLRKGDQIALCEEDEGQTPLRRKLTTLMGFEGISRVDVEERAAGDLFVIAGFPEVEIGDTVADPVDPKPLPRLVVDEPVLRMTIGVNTSPLAGKDGTYLTSRHLRERLDREVLGNVSIRLAETSSPDIIEVAGRGELQLSVLIESMRREGYEMQVSRPEVIVREINGKRHEPLERAVIDVPEEHVGTVTQALAPRKGKVTDLRPGDQPGAHRLPLAAAHRDPRHRPHAPAPRRLDPVDRRLARPQGRGHDRRPPGQLDRLRPRQPPSAWRVLPRTGRGGLRRHGRRRERQARRHDRQRRAREAEDQHPDPRSRRGHQAHAPAGADARDGHRIHRR
jgi:GTP-binding protein